MLLSDLDPGDANFLRSLFEAKYRQYAAPELMLNSPFTNRIQASAFMIDPELEELCETQYSTWSTTLYQLCSPLY